MVASFVEARSIRGRDCFSRSADSSSNTLVKEALFFEVTTSVVSSAIGETCWCLREYESSPTDWKISLAAFLEFSSRSYRPVAGDC